jgi:hypothetical protein
MAADDKSTGLSSLLRRPGGTGRVFWYAVQPDHQPGHAAGAGFHGDRFITEELKLTRRTQVMEDVLNQVNYGQPSALPGQVFGTGGSRAFQFAADWSFNERKGK